MLTILGTENGWQVVNHNGSEMMAGRGLVEREHYERLAKWMRCPVWELNLKLG